MTPPRIAVDFNTCGWGLGDPDRLTVSLTTCGSIQDLANAGIVLEEGMRLVGWDESDETEDLEAHGVARFDRKARRWYLEIDEAGILDVPARGRRPVTRISCVTCKEDVADRLKSVVDVLRSPCPLCGAPLNAPIRPPV